MRGKLMSTIRLITRHRITPADAGKTALYKKGDIVIEDHPRGCGENSRTSHTRLQPTGITPADAGKTCNSVLWNVYDWDHPRGCGENKRCLSPCEKGGGSPPRMRGKLTQIRVDGVSERITPADAGKTGSSLGNDTPTTDHPRGCGENYIILR